MTIHFNINNEEYRDMTSKSVYPFVDNASLTNGAIEIPVNLFLDALIYVSGEYTAPFYISSIDGIQGSDDQALMTISDYTNNEVGTAYLDRTTDMCYMKQGKTLQAGVFVYNKDAMIRFIGVLGKRKTLYTSLQTALAAGQCFAVHPSDIVAIGGPTKLWANDAEIVADNGVNFRTDGDDLVIDLYGEEPVPPGALLTINDIVFPEGHVWFAADPDSRLRILTGTEIQIADKKDISYGQ